MTNQPIIIEREMAKWYIPQACFRKLGNSKVGEQIGSGVYGHVYDLCESDTCNKVIKLIPFDFMNPDLLDDEKIDEYIYAGIQDEDVDDILFNEYQALMNANAIIRAYMARRDQGVPRNRYDDIIESQYRINPDHPDYFAALIKAFIDVFNNEVMITKYAAELGLSPKFYDAFICNNILQYAEEESSISMGFIIQEKWDMSLEKYHELYHRGLPQLMLNKLSLMLDKLHAAGIVHNDIHAGNIVLRIDKSVDQNIPAIVDVNFIDFGKSMIITPSSSINAENQFNRDVIIDKNKISRINFFSQW